MSATGIRLLIVDDEAMARKRLRQLLEPYGEQFVLEDAANGVEATAAVRHFQPQIVLLDVEMPQMSGLEFLQQLESIDFQVIFQTAYDEFAVQAFELNACDYLLKPVSTDGLARALGRATARLGDDHAPIAAFVQKAPPLRRLLVKVGTRTRLVEEEQIDFFSSKDHVTLVHFEATNYAIDLSLSLLEKRLDPSKFVRIHRNVIVALSRVAQFATGAEMTVTLKSGESHRVARDRQKILRELLAGIAHEPDQA